MAWITQQDNRSFWSEPRFLARWGVKRELRKSSFVRGPEDITADRGEAETPRAMLMRLAIVFPLVLPPFAAAVAWDLLAEPDTCASRVAGPQAVSWIDQIRFSYGPGCPDKGAR